MSNVTSYALWNNKGGVGKSTITFHLATRYAELNPNANVLVADLCPQANASMMLLGGGNAGEERSLEICTSGAKTPKTVVGYFATVLSSGEGAHRPDPNDFIIRPMEVNQQLPHNLWMLCGDGNLEPMAPLISQRALQAPLTEDSTPWKWVHQMVKHFVDDVGKIDSDKEWVVFIDTNPSFSIYTEIAISGASQLLVPVNADDASRVATNAMFALVFGPERPHPFYGKYTYAAKAQTEGIARPKVKLIIGNRLTQYVGAAKAYGAISDATATSLYEAYKNYPQRFSDADGTVTDVGTFRSRFSVLLRDFNTAGVVSAHRGCPMSKLTDGEYNVYEQSVYVRRDRIEDCQTAIDDVVTRISPAVAEA